MSGLDLGFLLAIAVQAVTFIWKFSKMDSAIISLEKETENYKDCTGRVKALEKDILELKDVKTALSEISVQLSLLNQNVNTFLSKTLQDHEEQIRTLEKEVQQLKVYNASKV